MYFYKNEVHVFVQFYSYYKILIFSGLLSWDETSCHVDLAAELDTITNASPPGEESRGGKFWNVA